MAGYVLAILAHYELLGSSERERMIVPRHRARRTAGVPLGPVALFCPQHPVTKQAVLDQLLGDPQDSVRNPWW